MPSDGYTQFCPVAKASEMLEPRWTMLVLSELWSGSTRFNEVRRGLPGLSPTLLSKRLKDMEASGLVVRTAGSSGGAGGMAGSAGEVSYRTTPLADELRPIVQALGQWAHRNVDVAVSLRKLDARVLMWNMRRRVDRASLPRDRRSVIQFTYPELPEAERHYWLVAAPGGVVDLCLTDPGFDVDLTVIADLYVMTSAWMGHSSLRTEIAHERITLVGDRRLASTISAWMVRSSFAAA